MTNMYEFEGRLIRAQKDGNEIWFRGRDVAEALGYKGWVRRSRIMLRRTIEKK